MKQVSAHWTSALMTVVFGVPLALLAGCAAPQSPPTAQTLAPEEAKTAAPETVAEPLSQSAVQVTDAVTDEGLDCFQIKTPSATYYYHKQGAGFTSLVDVQGNDWIGFHPDEGPQGTFRGIPNMGLKHFGHPGSAVEAGIVSKIESSGPNQAVISSQSADEQWKVRWTFYPDRAELQVLKADGTYWFLYEGTPGGSFEPDRDYFVRGSDQGKPQAASEKFAEEMAGPEWIYFGDRQQKRVLLLVKHEDDCWPDRYFPMDGMTVFGFGRAGEGTASHLRGPAKFTVSLMDTTDHATIAAKAAEIAK